MKVLVIGASGYLGSSIYKKLKDQTVDDIYGTCFSSNNLELMKIDVLKESEVQTLLSLEPDIIIWSIKDMGKETILTQTAIDELVRKISGETRFIYVSTAVGKGKGQDEEVFPYNRMPGEYLFEYFNGKINGEKLVKKHHNHVIVRPGSIYGYDCIGNMDSRMKILFQTSRISRTYLRTANMYNSFVHLEDLTDSIVELVYSDFTGTINVSAEKEVSYYEFNLHLAKLMNMDSSFIIPDYKPIADYNTLNNDKRKRTLTTKIREIDSFVC